MPLYKTITVAPKTRVFIWKVTEAEASLGKEVVLSENSKLRVSGMLSEIHRRGYLSIRHLLKLAGYTDNDLFYDDNGKPHLKDGAHISITHSFEFTGIIVSDDMEVGIDIEKKRDKIMRIARKFTPLNEYRTLANEEALIRKLTMVWGAKESLYKIMACPGLSFLNHIHIDDFEMEHGGSSGSVFYKGARTGFDLKFLEFEDYVCAYALKN